MNISELFDTNYPRQNRFVVTFTSEHQTTTGGICTQRQRRFRLADSAEQALADVMAIDLAEKYWPKPFHTFRNVHVQACPEMRAYAFGQFRFKDIRV